MSRSINKLFVYDTANFAGLASFNGQSSLNSVNLVLNTGSYQIGIGSGVQSGAHNVYLPDSISTSNATFVLVDQPQVLTNKTLQGATITATTLTNATLINPNISGASITTSTMTSSTISNTTINTATINSPTVSNATINTSYLYNPILTSATINTSYMYSSFVTNSTITNSYLVNPEVNQLLDTNGNLALLINPGSGSNNTTWQALSLGGSSSNTVTLGTTGASGNINIAISPKGTGRVTLRSLTFPTGQGSAGQILVADGAGNLNFQLGDLPQSFTVQTTSSATTTIVSTSGGFNVTPTNNQSVYITIQGAAATTSTSDNLGATFDLRTAYLRVTAPSSVRKIQNPLTDDILSFRDSTAWNIYTQANTTSGNVELVVIGDNVNTIDWQFYYQTIAYDASY